jgi:hypothetical protein
MYRFYKLLNRRGEPPRERTLLRGLEPRHVASTVRRRHHDMWRFSYLLVGQVPWSDHRIVAAMNTKVWNSDVLDVGLTTCVPIVVPPVPEI